MMFLSQRGAQIHGGSGFAQAAAGLRRLLQRLEATVAFIRADVVDSGSEAVGAAVAGALDGVAVDEPAHEVVLEAEGKALGARLDREQMLAKPPAPDFEVLF